MSEKREYKECYVAIIDLLGFKNAVKGKTCEEIARYYDKIHENVTVLVEGTNKPLVPRDKIHTIVMSDTVCIIVECSEPNSLAGLLAVCAFFQVKMMHLKDPVLSRGAVVKGKVYYKDDVFFGDGIVNAYLLEEKVAIYPRVILTKETIDDAFAICDDDGKYYLKMHTFNDIDMFYCIDSLLLFYAFFHEKEDWVYFEKHVERVLYSETNPSIREKYKYIYDQFPRIRKRFNEIMAEENNV